ncbi:TPA: hypothetical protein QEM49_001376 [Pseudomonas putida]|uniref:hypothetical protein n=1 Tax=Pseudomonas putida TaxID=303 RepID=UPI00236423D4|nr:hypothetical protein [Pseudomonas putida]MDD2010307.1 hypothetical protein [Pseudomonas putida]HDS1776892.1 hypothetical protein [Pseudomonas putida]
MSPIIHCIASAEPDSYHGQSGVYAINLSFDCFSNDIDDEATAREAFWDFLTVVQRPIQFVVYRVDGQTLKKVLVVQRQNPELRTTTDFDRDLFTWLKHRARADKKSAFWTRKTRTNKDVVSVDSAGAGPLLRAAQAWNAPVGHHFGLTYLIEVDISEVEIANHDYVVLPFFYTSDAPQVLSCNSRNSEDTTLFECIDTDIHVNATPYFGSGITDLACSTAALNITHKDLLKGRLSEEGYFKVNPDAIALRRLLTGFEHRAAGLMATTPSLMPRGKVLDDDQAEEEAYEQLFHFVHEEGKTWVPAMVTWGAVTGLLLALDNIIIALMKPTSERRSEGELLAPLISAIEIELDRAGVQRGPSRQDIAEAIRSSLGQSPLIKATDKIKDDPGSKLVAALRHVYGLSDKAGANAPLEMQLLIALLEHADQPAPFEISEGLLKAMGDTQPLVLLMRALSGIQAQLAEESGAETAIIRLFESAARNSSSSSVAALIGSQLTLHAIEPIAKAWSNYCLMLNGPFNGAEAVRRGASLEFINAIFADKEVLKTINGPDPKVVVQRIQEAAYFPWRVGNYDGPFSIFKCILDRLVSYPYPEFPDHPPFPPDGRGYNVVQRHLFRAYEVTVLHLGDLSGEGKRFVPDLVPQPLPLQIAGDVTGDLFDHFLDDFNGIAIAIKRNDTPYGHANLAELKWGTPLAAAKPKVPVTLHPFLPSVNDGRGPAFIEYHGTPFADASLAGVLADPSTDAAGGPPVKSSFYLADVVEDLQGQPALPRLAYGCWYQSYAFAITNAGVLPHDQQLSTDVPWLPGNPKEPANTDLIAQAAYQRRTAIGDLEILELDPDNQKIGISKERQRLNRNLPDVVALSSDYPRVSVIADAHSSAILDLYRESDGIGALALAFGKKKQTLELSFADIQLSGNVGRIWLVFLKDPAPFPFNFWQNGDPFHIELSGAFRDAWGSGSSLGLMFESELISPTPTGETPGYEVVISLLGNKVGAPATKLGHFTLSESSLLWMRLVLEADSERAAMSFAAPEGPKGSRPAPSLLLMAESSMVWQPNLLTQPAYMKVKTPRVGFLDFQRWMANPKLRANACGGDQLLADTFYRDLEALYALRHTHPLLGEFFDRLPDPAVQEIRLALCETDRLVAGDEFLPHSDTLHLAKPAGLFHSIATHFTEKWEKDFSRTEAIQTLMREIEDQFSFKVTINAGAADLQVNSEVIATVPVGSVAHFTVEAMVHRSLFSPSPYSENDPLFPIHEGLLQYACSFGNDHYAFPAASLCIETMVDAIPLWEAKDSLIADKAHKEIIALADRMIGLKSAYSARRYDLITEQVPLSVHHRNAWRVYSHVTVITQQWLYSGRPLYRALNPKKFVCGRPADNRCPVTEVVQRLRNDRAVLDFEDELFFDRSNINADSLPRKLDPLPASTVLQTITWDSPSASYWRHRFTLKSRYAGALKTASRREVAAFVSIEGASRMADTWTLRASMFADLARIQLTRPQLRALIPLTTTTAGDTPSVLALLQEPPMAYGGLADRVSAELKTGFGYRFVSRDVVEIDDARKEVGPDPTLTYSAMPKVQAAGLALLAEGPIGLTFDAPHVNAPMFANSMFSLTPTLLDTTHMLPLEEHFLGVVMQRHLDPDWLPDPPAKPEEAGGSVQSDHDADRCWWIEMPLDPSTNTGLMWADTNEEPFLSLKYPSRQVPEIRVSKEAIDGVTGSIDHDVAIVSLPKGTSTVAVLHQPIAPGQYGLSIFMPRGLPDITRGHSGNWQKVASIVWNAPKCAPAPALAKQTDDEKTIRRIRVSTDASVQASAASAPTFLAWTRTNRDFSSLTYDMGNRSTERCKVSDLSAQLASDTIRVTYANQNNELYLVASTEANPQPIHRHRQLAYLITRMREEPGRPVEEYVECGLFVGKKAIASRASKSDRLNLRLIEIEAPAVILSGTDITNMPNEFRNHVVDLVATGCNRDGQLNLFVRFVGSDRHLPANITMNLGLLKAGQDPKSATTVPINFAAKDNKVMRGMVIYIKSSNVYATLILLDGRTIDVTDPVVTNPFKAIAEGLKKSVGLLLKVDKNGGPGECWCDISMLHSVESSKADGLDFDWLFSRESPTEMTQALQPEVMGRRTEAQARIVSISPPIAMTT